MGTAKGPRCHLYKHGGAGTRLYNIWKHIKQRTGNPHDKNYPDYGGHGITICPEWEDNFPAFREWALNTGYADNLSIDRINNDKGYSPDNCRWIPFSQQPRNRRNSNMITAKGITDTVAGWSARTGIPAETIRSRVNHLKWTPERAITEGANQ